jgi:hypothetical protein
MEITCPKCKAPESHPRLPDSVLIRGLKVYDEDGTAWSQCLVCSGYYDWFDWSLTPENHDPKKGWFAS